MLLDYSATYPNEIIRYKTSNMVLHVDSDAEYVTMTEARSCYAVHLYLSDWPPPNPMKPNSRIKGHIHTECKTIRNIISLAAEAKTYITFNNRKQLLV